MFRVAPKCRLYVDKHKQLNLLSGWQRRKGSQRATGQKQWRKDNKKNGKEVGMNGIEERSLFFCKLNR